VPGGGSTVAALTVGDRRTEWQIMNVSELKKLLNAGEWKDIEFKEARTDVPKSAFETVSAFANTRGGRLVFGVAQRGQVYEVTGVENPEKVQNDFLSVLHADA
jgi:ATP-dependent DNA helicase RecG